MATRKLTLFEIVVGFATIVACIMTVLTVPEFRQWAGLENPELSTTPTQTYEPLLVDNTQSNFDCVPPQQLATQKGWEDMGWADEKYCGLRVNITTSDELPALWEAIGVKRIYQNDQDRLMPPGIWSIYPPFSCREVLGCSQ